MLDLNPSGLLKTNSQSSSNITLPECKIVKGRAFNVKENKENPVDVFVANFGSIANLYNLVQEKHPRVCFIGSSCMYPDRDGALVEEMLGTGQVYEGNALYAYIKLLGWQICKAASKDSQFFMVIPSEIFGEATSSHFITEMMKKMHRAKENHDSVVTFWGTGTAIRHPIFKEDYERILKRICESYRDTLPINIAPPVGQAKSVCSIALDIREVVGFKGTIEWDAEMPDGQKTKILDNSRLTKLGYSEFTPWKESLEKAYNEIKNHI